MKQILHSIILCMSFGMLLSCSSSALHEAQQTVSQADSLWSAGQSCDDSLALAQAYKTLGYWRWFYPDNYVHACYHYGRLLRQKEDPVAAMQAFINATHSRTHDYRILGRVYSNMGSICHLANEFPLSYDMYERSADMFLRNGDTLNYYYALNDMAFELAEQGKKEECLALVSQIEDYSPYTEPQSETYRTKAILYRNTGQYDSALYYANKLLHSSGYLEPTTMTVKAQVFDNLGRNDSALIYAHMVLNAPHATFQNKFNALYIVKHCDSTLCADEIGSLYSQREDIRYYQYEPIKEKLILSVQSLQQALDNHSRYNKIKLYTVIACALIFFIVIYIVYQFKRQHKIFIRKEETTLRILEEREKELSIQQKQTLHRQTEYAQSKQQRLYEIENRCNILRNSQDLKGHIHWRQYTEMCLFIDQYFFLLASKLKQQPNLKERDVRMCILVLLNLSYNEIAELMYVEERSVGKLKERTAKKLKTSKKNMHKTLLEIVLGDKLEDTNIKMSSLENT